MNIIFSVREKHPDAPKPYKLQDVFKNTLSYSWVYSKDDFVVRLPLTGESISLSLPRLDNYETWDFTVVEVVWQPDSKSVNYRVKFDDTSLLLIKRVSLDDWQTYCEKVTHNKPAIYWKDANT